MEITSKRHPYKFYLTLLLVNLFIFSLGALFLIPSIRESNNKLNSNKRLYISKINSRIDNQKYSLNSRKEKQINFFGSMWKTRYSNSISKNTENNRKSYR